MRLFDGGRVAAGAEAEGCLFCRMLMRLSGGTAAAALLDFLLAPPAAVACDVDAFTAPPPDLLLSHLIFAANRRFSLRVVASGGATCFVLFLPIFLDAVTPETFVLLGISVTYAKWVPSAVPWMGFFCWGNAMQCGVPTWMNGG